MNNGGINPSEGAGPQRRPGVYVFSGSGLTNISSLFSSIYGVNTRQLQEELSKNPEEKKCVIEDIINKLQASKSAAKKIKSILAELSERTVYPEFKNGVERLFSYSDGNLDIFKTGVETALDLGKLSIPFDQFIKNAYAHIAIVKPNKTELKLYRKLLKGETHNIAALSAFFKEFVSQKPSKSVLQLAEKIAIPFKTRDLGCLQAFGLVKELNSHEWMNEDLWNIFKSMMLDSVYGVSDLEFFANAFLFVVSQDLNSEELKYLNDKMNDKETKLDTIAIAYLYNFASKLSDNFATKQKIIRGFETKFSFLSPVEQRELGLALNFADKNKHDVTEVVNLLKKNLEDIKNKENDSAYNATLFARFIGNTLNNTNYSNIEDIKNLTEIYNMLLDGLEDRPELFMGASIFFASLIRNQKDLPSIDIGLRNLKKDLKNSTNVNDRYKAFNQLVTITFEELNRRGLTDAAGYLSKGMTTQEGFRDYPSETYYFPDYYRQISSDIGEVYDFGLDIFHGFEAFTQAGRPIALDDKRIAASLERSLKNLAHKSSKLNCSKTGHLDLEFPGNSWYFEGFDIPQLQKDYLKSLELSTLKKLGFRGSTFSKLENTRLAIMRGGIILDNSEIKLHNSRGELEKYSLVIYNDHFDNPSNTVMLLVPSSIIREKLNASKIDLDSFNKFDPNKPDILQAGLDAKSLLNNPDTVNLISPNTIKGGFGKYSGHEATVQAVKQYKAIWRQLQFAMSLHDKGYLNYEKFDLEQLNPTIADNFDYSDLQLNELLNWNDWFIRTENKAATPVLVDVDPFRLSDEKDWSFKIDPAGDKGIEVTVRNDGQEEVQVIERAPKNPNELKDWQQSIKNFWGGDIYSRIFNKPLTRAFRFYNRKQV